MTVPNERLLQKAAELFENIDQYAQAGLLQNNEKCSRCFLIADSVVSIECVTRRLLDYFSWQLRLFQTSQPAQEGIQIWTDPIAGELSRDYVSGRDISFELDTGGRKLQIYIRGAQGRIIGLVLGWCNAQKIGWVIIDPEQLETFIEISYILTPLFSRMTAGKGMSLLHSAAVGTENKGVLLSGISNAGKSSLAMACLMTGMDYVSDDALFLQLSDLRAYPTCSTIHVAPSLLQIFPELQGDEFPSRNGSAEKKHIDISKFHSQIRCGLPIRAIISLTIAEEGPFDIRPVPWARATVPLLYSSAQLLGETQNAPAVRNAIKSLRRLPSYEFRMSSNLRYNATLLKNFIKTVKEEENV